MVYHFLLPTAVCDSFSSSLAQVQSKFLLLAILVGVKWYHLVDLICIFLMPNRVESLS